MACRTWILETLKTSFVRLNSNMTDCPGCTSRGLSLSALTYIWVSSYDDRSRMSFMSRLRMRACNFSSCSDEALHVLHCLLSKPNFNRSVVCVRIGMRGSGHCYIFFCAFVAYADGSAALRYGRLCTWEPWAGWQKGSWFSAYISMLIFNLFITSVEKKNLRSFRYRPEKAVWEQPCVLALLYFQHTVYISSRHIHHSNTFGCIKL